MAPIIPKYMGNMGSHGTSTHPTKIPCVFLVDNQPKISVGFSCFVSSDSSGTAEQEIEISNDHGRKRTSHKKHKSDHSWVHLEDFVMDQYKRPNLQDPNFSEQIERKHPQPRWACYSRLTPKLNPKASSSAKFRPPYGIQLISQYKQSLK